MSAHGRWIIHKVEMERRHHARRALPLAGGRKHASKKAERVKRGPTHRQITGKVVTNHMDDQRVLDSLRSIASTSRLAIRTCGRSSKTFVQKSRIMHVRITSGDAFGGKIYAFCIDNELCAIVKLVEGDHPPLRKGPWNRRSPPLRFAPVPRHAGAGGMTRARVVVEQKLRTARMAHRRFPRFAPVEKHFHRRVRRTAAPLRFGRKWRLFTFATGKLRIASANKHRRGPSASRDKPFVVRQICEALRSG